MAKPSIYGLDKYGLTLKELLALKERLISVRAHICYADRSPLFRFPPETRRKKSSDMQIDLFKKLREIWPSDDFEIIGSKTRPGGLSGQIKAADLPKLLKKNIVAHIWVENIDGIKKRKPEKKKLWFAVKAHFAIQIEGQTSGYQDVEERTVIVKAYDCNDAKKRLMKDFREYDSPHLNKYGYMVRWHFEKVVDVYEIIENTIDPNGTEVYSEFIRRRVKPELEWHPLKEMKRKKRV